MNRKLQDRQESEAAALVTALGLAPHPEGGWYRETWRAEADDAGRSRATAILYLLERGGRSHWHRVDADELWFWHAGAALDLGVAPAAGLAATWTRLGPDVLAGERPQLPVPAGHWQSAEAGDGWALVSCAVAPGFDFAGFELAPDGWTPG